MLFLPGSLISSTFGMGFVSTAQGTEGREAVFTASNKWWIYLAIAVPLTVVVTAVMIYYQRTNENTPVQSYKVPISDEEAHLSDKKQS